MTFAFNPFTSNFDMVGSSGGTSTTLTYYLSGSNSSISGYESLKSLAQFVPTTEQSVGASASTTPTIIEEFATDVGYPNITKLVAGSYGFHYETQKSAGSNNYYTYIELYKRVLAGTETLLLTSDNSSSTALNTRIQQTVTGTLAADVTLLTTDRLVIKVYAVMVSSTATITLYWDNNTNARITLPFISMDATNFVPYVGATSNVNLSTYTLTAGALYATSTTPNLQLESAAANATNAGTITFRTPGGSEYCTFTFNASSNIFNFNYGASTFQTMTSAGMKSVFDQGNVSTPSIRFTNYSTTGFYMPSANNIGATVSSTQVMNINSNGIGVGGNNANGSSGWITAPSMCATSETYGFTVQNSTEYIETRLLAPSSSGGGGIYGNEKVYLVSGVNTYGGSADIEINAGKNYGMNISGNIYLRGYANIDGGPSSSINLLAGTSNGSTDGYLRIMSYASAGYFSIFGVSGRQQATTAIGGASYTNNGGTALTDTDTFNGYTIGQVVQALQEYGWLQ